MTDVHPDGSPAMDRDLPLRERKKRRTRRALADTALLLFSENGFEAVTLDELVDAVEIAKRTFFRYYSSKESVAIAAEADLWQATVDRFEGTDLRGLVLDALRGALIAAIKGMDEDWDRRFVATRRLIATTPALHKHSMVLSDWAQSRLAARLETRFGRDRAPALRLLCEIALGAYWVGARTWTVRQERGEGPGGSEGREALARCVEEAFDLIPSALRLGAE
ncbi:TetR family transcriptional regulator [Streptomyces platensis]|uniref:TetR family transcriptional regulator n=1 Tax=Streptomyces platensis TaxID=58346 RepID=UPI0038653B12|nr:TetR family transcriptional regulator [Streptomyces platensis]